MAGERSVTLLSRTVCEDLVTARFSRPEGYSFAAGQWLRLGLGPEGAVEWRTLSHASAPEDEHIEIATRKSDSTFKNTLAEMSEGDSAYLTGPGGRFRIPDGSPRVICLTGGVGITPIRSMLRHAAAVGESFEDFLLVYGNRSTRCVPYLHELQSLGGIGVRVVPVFETGATPDLELGFITADTVRRHIDDVSDSVFVVSGPPAMVTAMTSVLEDLGVPAALRVVESFGAPAVIAGATRG